MASVLIVDDQPGVRNVLRRILGARGHEIHEARDGREALERARAQHPELIISDIVMPTMDGFELVHQLRSDPALSATAVIFHTATYHQPEALALAQDCGVVCLLEKPSSTKTIVKTVDKALRLRRPAPLPPMPEFERAHANLLTDTVARKVAELEEANRQLTEAYDATLEGWVRALDLRDKETEGHTQRVTEGAVRLARAMGMVGSELIHLRRGALLHDIGKIGIPDAILHKPGPLTKEEWDLVRRHPEFAYQLLSPIEYLRPALDIPYYHHEKWDGSGYPCGLKERQIPLAARIFAVVDVWDALRSDRPYHKAWPEQKTREHISDQSGKHFDPEVVDQFMRLEPRSLAFRGTRATQGQRLADEERNKDACHTH